MSRPQEPPPVKLVVGAFTAERGLFETIAQALAERFGPVDLMSPWFAFDRTDYYEKEMGGPLFRRLVCFSSLLNPDDFPGVKLFTNDLEKELSRPDGSRRVNIDPGYVTAERFILATGKNYIHRIYIGQGIFADMTLLYKKGRFRTLEWTYPDYATPEMIEFLTRVRNKFLADRRQLMGKKP